MPNKTRSSSRLAKFAPHPSSPSLLLSLPSETIDLIFAFAVPPTLSSRRQRSQLYRFLLIHPSLSPLIRRRIYHKATLNVGDPRWSDKRFVGLLEDADVGRFVKYLKIRLPDVDPSKKMDLNEDPALAILPAPRLDQKETVNMVGRALDKIMGPRYLEMDARVGTRIEGETIPEDGSDAETGGSERLVDLARSMSRWKSTLQTFIFAVADPQQRLQVYSDYDLSYQSPFVNALQSWNSLTQLDLWLVRLKLDPNLAPPEFKLKNLRLRDVELSSAFELEWLIGKGDDGRGTNLTTLILQDLQFTSTPNSSSPLLSIFTSEESPPFASSLAELQLHLVHPLGSPTPSNVLSCLINLETLLIGGAGVDLPLFASIFPPLSGSTSLQTPYPSRNIKQLTLNYLIHPSLRNPGHPPLLKLSSHSFHTTLFTHLLSPRAVPHLKTLAFQPNGRFPRTFTWKQRRDSMMPTWFLRPEHSTSTSDESDAWEEFESPLRHVNRQRRKENLQNGGQGETGNITWLRNRSEIEYADVKSDGEDDEDQEEEEFDEDALFEPSSDEEQPMAVIRRDHDSDSDF